jgi:hypothetical protein
MFGRGIAKSLEQFVEYAIGVPVTIDNVIVGYTGYLTIEGVHIKNPQFAGIEWESTHMVKLDRVEANANIFRYMWNPAQLTINEVDVKGLKACYEVKNGKCNIKLLEQLIPEVDKRRHLHDLHGHEALAADHDIDKAAIAEKKRLESELAAESETSQTQPGGPNASTGSRGRGWRSRSPPEAADDSADAPPKHTNVTLKRVVIDELDLEILGPVQVKKDSKAVRMEGFHVNLEDLHYDNFNAQSENVDSVVALHHFAKGITQKIVDIFL